MRETDIPLAAVKVNGGAVRLTRGPQQFYLATRNRSGFTDTREAATIIGEELEVQPKACACEHSIACRFITALKMAGGPVSVEEVSRQVWGHKVTAQNLAQVLGRAREAGHVITRRDGMLELRGR